jgi:hypothetical protein
LSFYRELTGDGSSPSLTHHYWAYRAHSAPWWPACATTRVTRTPPPPGSWSSPVSTLEQARVRLVVVGGRPATGKSTPVAGIADLKGWTLLGSDEIRKQLAGLQVSDPSPAPYGQGLYTAEATEMVYAELLGRARVALELGEPVVLEASWTDPRQRAAAVEIDTTASQGRRRGSSSPGPLRRAQTFPARRRGGPGRVGPNVLARAGSGEMALWPAGSGTNGPGAGSPRRLA